MNKIMTLENAEKQADKILSKNNYRYSECKCCGSCKYSEYDLEEGYFCKLAEQEEWLVNQVNPLCICDAFTIIVENDGGVKK